jgi:hypothetical protein
MNRTIELLENGQPALGVLSADYSLSNARTLAGSNLDFIIIDMEHFPFDVERLQMFLLGMTDKRRIQQKGNLQMNVTPFVRVPATGAEQVLFQAKQVLDVGVFGVMYPSIRRPRGHPTSSRQDYAVVTRPTLRGFGASVITCNVPMSGHSTRGVTSSPSSRSKPWKVSRMSRRS